MNRKTFLKKSAKGTLVGAAVLGTLNACTDPSTNDILEPVNINFNKQFNWRMVSVWPKNFPVFGTSDNRFIEYVERMSGNRLKVKLFAKGELVPALESFDTVQDGTADIGSGCAYYWMGKLPAAAFFATSPFGMNAQQHQSWLMHGGGYELWKKYYADFNLLPLISGNSGVQMGGWFNKEINSKEDLKGLKMRIPGLGARALERAGGAAMNVPGGEIYTNLERGVIDATEWVGPYHDYLMGFYKVAKYYYTPGWHEPGTQLEFFVNLKKYNQLPSDLQEIIKCAAAKIQSEMLAEFDSKNGEYLQKILETNVQLKVFPDDVLQALKLYNRESIDALIQKSSAAREVADSYYSFKQRVSQWTDITEKVYYNKIQNDL